MSIICRPSAAVPKYVSQAHASGKLSPPAVRVVKTHIRGEGAAACSDSSVLASPTIPIVAAACLIQSRNGFHKLLANCLSLCVSKRTSLSVQMHLPYKATPDLDLNPDTVMEMVYRSTLTELVYRGSFFRRGDAAFIFAERFYSFLQRLAEGFGFDW